MRRAGPALLAASLLVAGASHAFTRAGATWAPAKIPVPYKVNVGSVPASIGATAATASIEAAFTTWSAPPCTVWRARNDGTSTVARPSGSDQVNVFLWISGAWPSELGAVDSTIGITTSTYFTNGSMTDADISYNNVGFRWGNGSGGTVDAQSIMTHEQGHFLGLGHTTVSGSVMIASYSSGQVRSLSADDRAGVCTLYPVGYLDAGAPADAGPTGLGFGASCNGASECASGLCIADANGGGGFCSKTCTDDCGCPSGNACYPLQSGGRVCAPGTNRCGADAGVRDAGAADAGARDASTTGRDAGVQDASVQDASIDAPSEDASAEPGGSTPSDPASCACRLAANQAPDGRGVVVAAAFALLGARRRRSVARDARAVR